MSDYEQILSLIDDERVKAGLSMNQDLGVKFALGQTRYVWRYGTLSDGHEKITPAQRYFQANKEIYFISNSIEDSRFAAMEAKADLLAAEDAMTHVSCEIDTLRAAAAIGRAKAKLRRALDQVQDLLRGLDELCKIKSELEPGVLSQYPEGIEQAEEDNWRAIFEYRVCKEKLPGSMRQPVDSIPLPPRIKAELGYKYGRVDAIAPLALTQPAEIQLIEQNLLQENT